MHRMLYAFAVYIQGEEMAYEYELIDHFEGTSLKTFLVSINQRFFHWHHDTEILLVLDGSVQVKTGKQSFVLEKDDMCIFNCNELHSLHRTQESNIILAIQFNPRFCKDYYPSLQNTRFNDTVITKKNNPVGWKRINENVIKIITLYCSQDKAFQFLAVSALNNLVYKLLRNLSYDIATQTTLLAEGKNLARLNKIIDFIQDRYMDKITLEEIAKSENLNASYLSHFIKKNLNITFRQYVNKIRLAKAVELITKTDMNKIDVCMESGFSDYRYLSKMFKQEYGCTPSQYNNKYSKLPPQHFNQSYQGQHKIIDSKQVLKLIDKYLNK